MATLAISRPAQDRRWAGSGRRAAALARAELRLLVRNPIALLTALTTPLLGLTFLASSPLSGAGWGAGAVTGVTATALGIAVYYNLVTALVARREALVLKRLRSGELTDAEIVAGTAMPSLLLAALQFAITLAAAVVAGHLRWPVNPLPLLIALVAGALTFVLLAAATAAFTRTLELAQVTTLPGLMLPLLASGLLIPLHELPASLEVLGRLLPMTPVVDLMRLGLTGTAPDGRTLGQVATLPAALPDLAVAAAWIVLGAWVTRRWFRWEPRR